MNNIDTLIAYIKENSFGILVSEGKELINGTHLPFLVERSSDNNIKLISHMSKANQQWREINGEVLIIFSGAHMYISPTWYEEEGFVPTWDYQSVHVYGKYIPKNSPEDLREIMEKTIEYYEGFQTEPWNGKIPDHIYNRLIEGVVGFNIEVTDIQGQWKLHQDHPDSRKRKVVSALRELKNQDAGKIANEIEKIIEL